MMSIPDLRKQLYETALSADLPVISIDRCCQLLAWLYIFGGGCEQVVIDERLRNDILYAQRRLNIDGGKVPNPDYLLILQDYIKSITLADNWTPKEHLPEWVALLENDYAIKGRS